VLLMVVKEGEVAALRAEDLGERADVKLGGVGAGGGADPEPVPAADGLVVRHRTLRRETASTAQFRWPESADGSDTLAMAQIHWQRTPFVLFREPR
jgi:hypothetical protein